MIIFIMIKNLDYGIIHNIYHNFEAKTTNPLYRDISGGIFMSLSEILQKKLEEYTRDYGFQAGLDLLLMEIEAELWEIINHFI